MMSGDELSQAQREEARRNEEQARLEKARRNEEQARLEKARRDEEQARLEKARRDEEQARLEEAARRNEELQAQREEVRHQAKGEKMDRLETQKGKVYENLTINDVSPVGISISHDAGSARIPFEDLPMDLQKRFMFDRDEKEAVLAREQAHQSAHDASIATTPSVAPAGRSKTESERKRVMMVLASKEARIQTLEGEISRLQDDVVMEENKKRRRYGDYYYDSYGRRRYYYGDRTIGGISRAPIVREQLSNKERELATLKRQVAMLRVELDSASP